MRAAIFAILAAFALASPLCAAPVGPMPGAYDCQKHIGASDAVPAADAADPNHWQCTAPTAPVASSTVWQRHALEYCRLTTSVYDAALAAARRMVTARHFKRHGWVVLMDADETVLDNSLYQAQSDQCPEKQFNPLKWESWIHARATADSPQGMATDVPGAAAFTQAVHRMGGLVAIVTNRDAADDAITQDNLRRVGIWFDYEIGQDASKPDEKKSKLTRWRGAVTSLAARFHTKAQAVMWLGDQVTDLATTGPGGVMTGAMNQSDPGKNIGVDRFLLPNAMYGNWQPH
ncbi:MAG TPA: HAD family acid phosphatase [Rhizomicrobium sp.]|nr:HAD family acid phosphatase [Rhizomicrobium sp.]